MITKFVIAYRVWRSCRDKGIKLNHRYLKSLGLDQYVEQIILTSKCNGNFQTSWHLDSLHSQGREFIHHTYILSAMTSH